jgi:hypothetical protein
VSERSKPLVIDYKEELKLRVQQEEMVSNIEFA